MPQTPLPPASNGTSEEVTNGMNPDRTDAAVIRLRLASSSLATYADQVQQAYASVSKVSPHGEIRTQSSGVAADADDLRIRLETFVTGEQTAAGKGPTPPIVDPKKGAAKGGKDKGKKPPWEVWGDAGAMSPEFVLFVDASDLRYEYKVEIQAAPMFGLITGHIQRTGPDDGQAHMIDPWKVSWASVAGAISRHELAAGSFYSIRADGSGDAVGAAGAAKEMVDAAKGKPASGGGIAGRQVQAPGGLLTPYHVTLFRRKKL
jgi:hypothetical protein